MGRRFSPRWIGAARIEDLLVLGAMLLLPWAFGGVEIWAFRTAAWILVIAAAILVLREGPSGIGIGRQSLWLLPAVLLGVWAVVQLVPLPPAVVGVLSPTTHAIYHETFPGYASDTLGELPQQVEERAIARVSEAADLPFAARPAEGFALELGGRWQGWRPLSLLPSAGIERLLWYIALLLGFLVIRRRCAEPDLARLYTRGLFLNFLLLAIFGLLYNASANGKLYWVRPLIEGGRPFGPYVNPTNFAGVMELAVPWLVGYSLMRWRQGLDWRDAETRLPLVAATGLLCFVAALATASKSSGLLILGALVLLGWIAWPNWKWRLGVLGGAVSFVALAVLTLRQTAVGHRMEEFLQQSAGNTEGIERLVAWRAALPMWHDFLWVGAGFGAFRDVIPHYLPPGNTNRWSRLHNDYFEVLVEGGLIAALLLIWLIASYLGRTLQPLRRRAGPVDLEYVGLLLGLLTLSIHAAFDFNHQIPANALLFVGLAAIAVARAASGGVDEADA